MLNEQSLCRHIKNFFVNDTKYYFESISMKFSKIKNIM